MNVLLSIKPKYADMIFTREKLYEYRRVIWKRKVETVLVYSSSPIKKVIGEFEPESILRCGLDGLAIRTVLFSGISVDEFDEYFKGKDFGYAISIGYAKRYNKPKPLSEFGITRPPQNFRYIE